MLYGLKLDIKICRFRKPDRP